MKIEWSISWLGTTWWSWPPTDLPTFWLNVAAALIVLAYVVLTWKLLRTTSAGVRHSWTANQAGLLKSVLEEYAAMAEDVAEVRRWWQQDPNTAISRYEQGLKAPHDPNVATKMSTSRRRLSQYFLRLRAFCEKEMLDAGLVADTLGEEAVQVFLLYVDPLDETVRRVSGKAHKMAERDYFRAYLRTYFPDTAAADPWGMR